MMMGASIEIKDLIPVLLKIIDIIYKVIQNISFFWFAIVLAEKWDG